MDNTQAVYTHLGRLRNQHVKQESKWGNDSRQAYIPKGKFSGFQENLANELPCRGNDDGFRFLELTKGTGCGAVRHQLLQYRQQKRNLKRRTRMFNMCNRLRCQRIRDAPFYQIRFGHRPWDLCQQKWWGYRASAQGWAWYNQTCWYLFWETRTTQPHRMSAKQGIKLLSQYTISYIRTSVLTHHCT